MIDDGQEYKTGDQNQSLVSPFHRLTVFQWNEGHSLILFWNLCSLKYYSLFVKRIHIVLCNKCKSFNTHRSSKSGAHKSHIYIFTYICTYVGRYLHRKKYYLWKHTRLFHCSVIFYSNFQIRLLNIHRYVFNKFQKFPGRLFCSCWNLRLELETGWPDWASVYMGEFYLENYFFSHKKTLRRDFDKTDLGNIVGVFSQNHRFFSWQVIRIAQLGPMLQGPW
jgi:hypothetical protein